MNVDINNVWVKRAVRTFFQALVGYVTVNIALVNFVDEKEAVRSAVIGLAVSSIAAGISAVMNVGECDANENG